MCGRFAGRTKDWCLKVFLACDDIILDALASLGRDDMRPSLETILRGSFTCCTNLKCMHKLIIFHGFYTRLVELKEKAYHQLGDY